MATDERRFNRAVLNAAKKARLTQHVTASYMRREDGTWTVHIGHLDMGTRRYCWHQPWDGMLGPDTVHEALALLGSYSLQEARDIKAESY